MSRVPAPSIVVELGGMVVSSENSKSPLNDGKFPAKDPTKFNNAAEACSCGNTRRETVRQRMRDAVESIVNRRGDRMLDGPAPGSTPERTPMFTREAPSDTIC